MTEEVAQNGEKAVEEKVPEHRLRLNDKEIAEIVAGLHLRETAVIPDPSLELVRSLIERLSDVASGGNHYRGIEKATAA